MTEDIQKAAQEKALLYQIFNAQLEELAKQGAALETRMIELENAETALKEVSGSKESSDMLLPLGGGCYGYGTLTNKSKFMVEIGAGFVSEKTLPEAEKIIEAKKVEVEDVAQKLNVEIEHIRGSMDKIGLELQQFQATAQQEGAKKDDDSITVE